jgi:hypothetical protein
MVLKGMGFDTKTVKEEPIGRLELALLVFKATCQPPY